MLSRTVQLENGEIFTCKNHEQALQLVSLGGKLVKPRKSIRKPIPNKIRKQVLESQDYRCAFCFSKLYYEHTIDHIYPVSKADSYLNGADNINEVSNLQALCRPCNARKSAKLMSELSFVELEEVKKG